MEDVIYPDPKAALIAYLSEHLDVPVASRVPNTRPEAFVRVLLAGGQGNVEGLLSDVAFTVESWDNNESDAQARAQRIRGLLRKAYAMGGHPVYGYITHQTEASCGALFCCPKTGRTLKETK